jgi:hypothetical protein
VLGRDREGRVGSEPIGIVGGRRQHPLQAAPSDPTCSADSCDPTTFQEYRGPRERAPPVAPPRRVPARDALAMTPRRVRRTPREASAVAKANAESASPTRTQRSQLRNQWTEEAAQLARVEAAHVRRESDLAVARAGRQRVYSCCKGRG